MLNAERLKRDFAYDPDTGSWTRIGQTRQGHFGQPVASAPKLSGYVVITIDGKAYRAHRLAWLYMTGEWPSGPIDHANMVRSDNRWSNLRLATTALNNVNRRQKPGSKHGLKGVSDTITPGRYRARIKVGPRHIHIGVFDTPEEAHAAYCREAAAHYGEFANFGDGPSIGP